MNFFFLGGVEVRSMVDGWEGCAEGFGDGVVGRWIDCNITEPEA